MTSLTSPVPHLSIDTAQAIFDTAIVPIMLAEVFPHPRPSLTLVVGQPGSGVDAWTVMRGSAERDGPETVVDVHSLRSLFPGYARLCGELGGVQAAVHVEADVHRWLTMALEFLRTRRAKIVVEDDFPSVSTAALLAELVAAGEDPYPLDVALLAVSAAESHLALMEAYQHTRELLGHAVEPDDALHKHTCARMLEIAQWVDTDPGIRSAAIYSGVQDTACVTRRSADSSTVVRAGPRWPTGVESKSMRELFEITRGSSWDYARSQGWVRALSSLWTRMEPHWRERLSELDREAAPSLMFNTFWRMESTGMTIGHYPVITTTDVALLTGLLADHDRVLIGVLDPDADAGRPAPPILEVALRVELDRAAAETSAMMTPGEQVAMWLAVLQDADLRHRVDVTVVSRPELDPAAFSERFPYTDYRLVLPAPPPGLDPMLSSSYAYSRLLSGPVHLRPALPGQGPHRDLDSVRRAYRRGDPTWEHQLARGSLAAFHAADGPTRVLATSPASPHDRIDAIFDAVAELETPIFGPVAGGAAIGAAIEAALPPAVDHVRELTTGQPHRRGPDHGRSPTNGPAL